jgi:very-short-patch-repair endonuclease
MGGYIADFFCHSLRLVIELDGAVHDLQKGYDAVRDAWFRAQGYTVLRFSNEEVLGALEGVMQAIRERVEQDRPEAQGDPARVCRLGDR